MKVLTQVVAALSIVAQGIAPLPAFSNINSGKGIVTTNNSIANSSHSECLEARDYEGCVRVKNGQGASPPVSDCPHQQFCIAPGGTDMFGWPQIKGWLMKTIPSLQLVVYRSPQMLKVNVRGKTDRYVSYEVINRSYQPAYSGTPARIVSSGSGSTNCVGGGYLVTCTTRGPSYRTIPGTSGRTAGVVQTSLVFIMDCKDKTEVRFVDGVQKGKWKPITDPITRQNLIVCPNIESLPLSTFRRYAK